MLVVQKFGGTSVSGIERIKASSEIVRQNILSGKQVVVVVSAMAGETDKLISLFKEITQGAKEDETLLAEMDAIISTGEQICAGLFASYLNTIGIKARSFNGMQAGILTDSNYTKAQIEALGLEEVKEAMKNGFTPIITGFQGFEINSGRQTTFGRGGSDTSAIAIAAALKADKCEIYKDVDGVFTGDPSIIENPNKKPEIDYKTMLEIASSGTKVLELRSVNFASKYNIKTEVLSSFHKSAGTAISSNVNEKAEIQNISYSEKEAFAEIQTSNLLKTLEALNQNKASFKVVFFENDILKILVSITDVSRFTNFNFSFKLQENIAKISIIGIFLKSDKVLEKSLQIFEKKQIKPILTMTSETKITFLVEKNEGKNIYSTLHKSFLD